MTEGPDTNDSLAKTLFAHRPRETSGSISANRFAFQQTWALCHWLGLHEGGSDYVLILEFHDDILVLNSRSNPQNVEFFQVKTRRDTAWGPRDLLAIHQRMAKKKTGELFPSMEPPPSPKVPAAPNSILAKLLHHCVHFLPYIEGITFVSNARFDLPVTGPTNSKDRELIPLSDLAPSTLDAFRMNTIPQLGLVVEPPWNRVFLSVTPLSITDHSTHGAGVLAEFLERLHPGGRYRVQPLFRTLLGEIRRRATNEWHPVSFEELCRSKGVSRSDLEAFLAVDCPQWDPENRLALLSAQLTNEAMSYRRVRSIQNSWRRYGMLGMDPTDIVAHAFIANVSVSALAVAHLNTWQTLTDYLSIAMDHFLKHNGHPSYPLGDYLEGGILYEYERHENGQLPPSAPQHQKRVL